MNNFYQYSLNSAKGKYYKFKERLEKKISSGQFDSLSRKKKNQLVSRVDKYKSKLEKLGFSMKGATVATSVAAMAAVPAIGNAQTPNVYLTLENSFSGGDDVENLALANFDLDADLELLYSVPGQSAKIGNRIEDGDEISWDSRDVGALANMQDDFVIGDIDGDQDLDVVFSNGRIIYLALNDGEGNFQLSDSEYYYASSTFVGSIGGELGINDVDLVDFDSDGDVDVIVAAETNNLIAFTNDNGSFSKETLAVPGSSVTDFEFVDLDNDGDLDLVNNHFGYIDEAVGTVGRVYASENTAGTNAEPAFEGFEDIVFQAPGRLENLTILDADGDTDIDVFASRQGYGYLYGGLNQHIDGNTGIFNETTFSGIPQPSTSSIQSVVAADFDLDGDDDLILSLEATGSYLASLELNNFTGLSLSGGQVGNTTIQPTDIAVGDIDGDGALDFAGTENTATIQLVYDRAAPYVDGFAGDLIIDENTPSGSLVGYLSLDDRQGDDVTVTIEGDDAALFSFNTETNALTTAAALDWEELGSSLDVELVLSDATKSKREVANLKLRNLAEAGHGTFDTEAQAVFGTTTPVSIVPGDFDLDGDDDLFRSINAEGGGGPREILSSSFDNAFYDQNNGFFSSKQVFQYNPLNNAIFFDVDNDGDNELVGGEDNGSLRVFFFENGFDYDDRGSGGVVGEVKEFVIGDFDGDGSDDIATLAYYEESDYLTILERVSGGDYDLEQSFSQELTGDMSPAAAALPGYDFDIEVGDFDGDGFDDILMAKSSYNDVVYLGGELGLTSIPTTVVTGDDFGLSKVASSDFDNDGDTDFALLRDTDGNGLEIDLMINDGAASFSVSETLSVGGEDRGQIVAGDFDGDGIADLAVTYVSGYSVGEGYSYGLKTFSNDGNGSFTESQSIDNTNGLELRLMDADSDDDLDILVSNTEAVEVAVCCAIGIDETLNEDAENIQVFFNSNADPTGIDLSIGSLDEGIPLGNSVGTFGVEDPNANDTHVIFLADGDGSNDEDNDKFVIDGNQLIVIKDIDFDEAANLNIHVKAIDDFGKSVTEAFTLRVNEIPGLGEISLSITSVNESSPIGGSIGVFEVTDPNINNSYVLSLTEGDGTNDADNDKFAVVGDQLLVVKDIDLNDGEELSIYVKAINNFGKTTTGAFVLTVNEVLGLEDLDDQLVLYPNPGADVMEISFNERVEGSVEIKVSDLNGKIVHQEMQRAVGESFKATVDMQDHKSGIYLIELRFGDQVFKQRWVKND
ncbi:FG-GAP-like repeat-containing protein [Ekhidna sp.]